MSDNFTPAHSATITPTEGTAHAKARPVPCTCQPRAVRRRLPNKRRGIRAELPSSHGVVHLSTGEYEDGSLGEIFLTASKEGSFQRDVLSAFAVAVSVGLQYGAPLSAYAHTLRNHRMDPDLIRMIFAELEAVYVY